MRKLLLLVFLSPLFGYGQEPGIRFESGLSWTTIKAKARAEHKDIFMDCFATWCGPCKFMSRNIFRQKEVGDYVNSHFVCVAVQMDKTSHDDTDVTRWYGDVDTISRRYHVQAYPTYLFFSADGRAVHRFVGATNDGKEFIDKVGDALDTARQYYSVMEGWKTHKQDSTFLLRALKMAFRESDLDNVSAIGNCYIDCLKDPLSDANIPLIRQLIHSNTDKGYQLFIENAALINRVMGDKEFVSWTLSRIIFDEEVVPLCSRQVGQIQWHQIVKNLQSKYPTLGKELVGLIEKEFRDRIGREIRDSISMLDNTQDDWNKLTVEVRYRYPDYDCRPILLEKKASYYEKKKLWMECANTAYTLIHEYGNRIDERDMDNIAWDYIFMHSADKKIIAEAIKCVKRVIKNEPNQQNIIDTYANLLYKFGNKEEAIKWESKAITLAMKKNALRDLDEFRSSLQKMQNGQPTWNDEVPDS